MEILPIKTSLLRKNFSIEEMILKNLQKNKITPKNGDVLVISSKVLALSQERVVKLSEILPSAKAKKLAKNNYHRDARLVELIFREAESVFIGPVLTTLKDGILIPGAGIDLSNAPDGYAILWPKNPWAAAENLAKTFHTKFHLKRLGIIISDSRCTPLRWGVTGLALAWAGFLGVEDARGEHDIYGKPLTVTKKAVADNLASAALVVMGEAGERVPFVVIRDAPVKFTLRKQKLSEIFVKPSECIYSGIYKKNFLKS